jgi:hypothetical protein
MRGKQGRQAKESYLTGIWLQRFEKSILNLRITTAQLKPGKRLKQRRLTAASIE